MADGRKCRLSSTIQLIGPVFTDPGTVNQARAVRLAELLNDYRTLLLHISQQNVDAAPEDYYEEGFVVLRECLAAAQSLMAANYHPCPVTGQGNAETEKAELQRDLVILYDTRVDVL